MADNKRKFESFAKLYPYYLREHSNPNCRRLHYVGSILAVSALALTFFASPWWALAAPFAGYGFAWVSHAKIEKNKPATFTYPGWSLMADFVMLGSFVTGRLKWQLMDAGVDPSNRLRRESQICEPG